MRQIHVRFNIGRPDGMTWVDVTQFLSFARVNRGQVVHGAPSGIDSLVKSLEFRLHNDIENKFHPWDTESSWNQFSESYSPLLSPNAPVMLEIAETEPLAQPVATDWVTRFVGYLGDEIGKSTADGGVRCLARDPAKKLQSTYIERPKDYGSEEGTAIETVIQQLLDDNVGPGAVTLYLEQDELGNPKSPGFMLYPMKASEFENQTVWSAINKLASLCTWCVMYRWDPVAAEMRLFLYEPPRGKTAADADFILDYMEDFEVQELSTKDTDIRNAIWISYVDRETDDLVTLDPDDAIYAPYLKDEASIAKYGRKACHIQEAATSGIDTLEEALDFGQKVLYDLSEQSGTTRITMPLCPTMDIFKGIVTHDPLLSTDDMFWGVESVQDILDFSQDQPSLTTEVVASGRIVGAHQRWLQMETRPGSPGMPANPPATIEMPPEVTNVSADATFNGVELSFDPVGNRTFLDYYEVQHYVEPDSTWTYLASGKSTYFRFEFPANSIVHLRVRAVYTNAAKGPWTAGVVVTPRSLTENDMQGALFNIVPSSTPDPTSGSLADLWDMDTTTGPVFGIAPTITFKYPMMWMFDMVRFFPSVNVQYYVQAYNEDAAAWADVAGSAAAPLQASGTTWNVRRFAGNKMVAARQLRIVFLAPVTLYELKFWTITLADEILAQTMTLTESMKVQSENGSVYLDKDGLKAVDATGDYSQLNGARLAFYKNGSDIPYYYVKRVEGGSANDGAQVVFDPPFESPPNVIVSLNSIITFDPSNSTSKQIVTCSADNVQMDGFKVVANTRAPGVQTVIDCGETRLGGPANYLKTWTSQATPTSTTVLKIRLTIMSYDRTPAYPAPKADVYYRKVGDLDWIFAFQAKSYSADHVVYLIAEGIAPANYEVRLVWVGTDGTYGGVIIIEQLICTSDVIINNGSVAWIAIEGTLPIS